MSCGGSGYIEEVSATGLLVQLPCPGCEECASIRPGDQSGGTRTIEMGLETLADLQRAHAAIRQEPGADLPLEVAWGMLITYLPALIELSRRWMEFQQEVGREPTTSAYPILETGI